MTIVSMFRVGARDALRHKADAERPERRYHAEHGNDRKAL